MERKEDERPSFGLCSATMNVLGPDKRPWALSKIALGVLVTLLAVTESVDADLGFHLATGRAVLAQGAIPARNVMTFSEPNHAWLDHSALSSLALELAYRAAGLRGTRSRSRRRCSTTSKQWRPTICGSIARAARSSGFESARARRVIQVVFAGRKA